MSDVKNKAKRKAHPLSPILSRAHRLLFDLPGQLHSLATKTAVGKGDGGYTLKEHIENIKELLGATIRDLEKVCEFGDSIVLEQIARYLKFVIEYELKAGWRFVQLADSMRELRGQEKNNQVFQKLADDCGIPAERHIYLREFANLMAVPASDSAT